MAGLTAAAALHGSGRGVLTVDKGRGVGGRMATRRIGHAVFDQGAQFVTVRDPRFAASMAGWERREAAREWCRGFAGDHDAKGISSVPAVTLHATDPFSRLCWDRDRRETGSELLRACECWLGARAAGFEVHGWMYSRPVTVAPGPAFVALETPPLVFAGDAFGGARVEGAALSGWAAASALLRLLV